MSDTKTEYLEQECAELSKTIAQLRKVITADDNRLKDAAIRVWGEDRHGCDTADWLAEEILFLRKKVDSWKKENNKLKAQLKTISNSATVALDTVIPKKG